MEQILKYAQDGIFLVLFLYLFIQVIPQMRKDHKQDMKDMEERYDLKIQNVEQKAEERESKLMILLKMFGDKYDLISNKVDEVIKRLDK